MEMYNSNIATEMTIERLKSCRNNMDRLRLYHELQQKAADVRKDFDNALTKVMIGMTEYKNDASQYEVRESCSSDMTLPQTPNKQGRPSLDYREFLTESLSVLDSKEDKLNFLLRARQDLDKEYKAIYEVAVSENIAAEYQWGKLPEIRSNNSTGGFIPMTDKHGRTNHRSL